MFVGVQLTGASIITSYSSTLLKSSRLLSPNVATFIPTSTQYISIILFTFIVDRIGRKPLLLLSGAVIALSHIVLSVYSFCSTHFWSQCTELDTVSNVTNSTGIRTLLSVEFCDHITLVPMGTLILFRFGYGLGWGQIPNILLGEFFPVKVRSTAASLSICVSMTAIAFALLMFPYLLLGACYLFSNFGLFEFHCMCVCFSFIPETTGLSMEEIEDLFKSKIIFVKFRSPFPKKNCI